MHLIIHSSYKCCNKARAVLHSRPWEPPEASLDSGVFPGNRGKLPGLRVASREMYAKRLKSDLVELCGQRGLRIGRSTKEQLIARLEERDRLDDPIPIPEGSFLADAGTDPADRLRQIRRNRRCSKEEMFCEVLQRDERQTRAWKVLQSRKAGQKRECGFR
ncbi:hypothetical protein UY3_14537 [Chelonia mydas]|uniref:Uncharacterized protein n=1 Tax=Chelonia mydas TaxID=8469 RepID=M7AZ19_CHEMY|nr:hypothetical protein UY3_14537 [Chelonia mydas]